MDVMGNVYHSLGLYPRAQPLLEGAADINRRVLGPKSPETLTTMRHLAATFYWEGNYAEAEKLDRDLLDVERRVLGAEHPEGHVIEEIVRSGYLRSSTARGSCRKSDRRPPCIFRR